MHELSAAHVRALQRNVDFVPGGELHWREKPLRYPQVEVLTEIPSATLLFGVPMQYGGIRVTLDGLDVILESSSRMGHEVRIYRVNRHGVQIVRHP
ncbi:hypothetical protein [Rhodococcus sp. HNM0569]|uniref:hypothetical protein n=1 Tax=Rhodococcus sp. HNM0569 TaxID=2716340 RepID=UPI00146BD8D1|nr:hypothetical protein [Rhodococcus sp. HNM0569]NLU84373.1 hypothetical protein [Rhodococcus sp. HNM0569]